MAQQIRIGGHVVANLPAELQLDGLACALREELIVGRQANVVRVSEAINVRRRGHKDVVEFLEIDLFELKVDEINLEIAEEPRATRELGEEQIFQLFHAHENLVGFGVEIEEKVNDQIAVCVQFAALVENVPVQRQNLAAVIKLAIVRARYEKINSLTILARLVQELEGVLVG